MDEKKELAKIISPNTIDYLGSKAKEHNVGIKIEKKYPNGASESLSVWSKEGETVKKWEKIVIKK